MCFVSPFDIFLVDFHLYHTFCCKTLAGILSYLPSQDFDRYYHDYILPRGAWFWLILAYLLLQNFDCRNYHYLLSTGFDCYYPTFCRKIIVNWYYLTFSRMDLTGIILPCLSYFLPQDFDRHYPTSLSYLLSCDFDRYYPTLCRGILTGIIILPSVAWIWLVLSYLVLENFDW